MTQEDRELLLKDLSARFPYGVICKVEFKDSEGWKAQNMSLKGVFINECYFTTDIGSIYSKEFKPYLRPMSSMTEEELKTFYRIEDMEHPVIWNIPQSNWHFSVDGIDWLNAHHFDYRGLIEKGLAIAVTEENNPYV
jgi:hypothetical protein